MVVISKEGKRYGKFGHDLRQSTDDLGNVEKSIQIKTKTQLLSVAKKGRPEGSRLKKQMNKNKGRAGSCHLKLAPWSP